MKLEFSIDQIDKIVKKYLIPKLKKYTIFAFSGPLGAGKTTIIKIFLKQCGVEQIITSPTFTYLNVYKTQDGRIFNHFDLYRIPNLHAFINSGFNEYISKDLQKKNCWTLIEWPERIKPLLQDKTIKEKVYNISLSYKKDDFNYRKIEFIKN